MNFLDILTANNLAVFPLKFEGGTPAVFAWEDREAWQNPTTLPHPAYGINLTDEWIVVDHDAYKDELDNPIDKWSKELSETFCVKTGRGGLHYYFRNPTRAPIRKVLKKEFPNVEFLSEGCFVVGAGSGGFRKKGKIVGIYEVVHGSLSEASIIPSDLLDLILDRLPPKVQSASEVAISVSNPQGFMAWLRTYPPAIEGQSGDTQTYIACAKAKDFGLDKESALECLAQEWNERCEPPWELGELELKVEHAYLYSQNTKAVDAPELSHYEPMGTALVESFGDAPSLLDGHPDIAPNGALKPTMRNLNVLFSQESLVGFPPSCSFNGLFTYNVFANRIEYTRKPFFRSKASEVYAHPEQELILRDDDVAAIRMMFARRNGVEFPTALVLDVILAMASANPIHPIRDYIAAQVWDGIPRIERLFLGHDIYEGLFGEELPGYWGEFSPKSDMEIRYRKAVAKAFLIASVKRIFEPGCEWHNCLILAGPQHTGKSPFVKILGKPWNRMLPMLEPGNRDFLKRVCESWWMEFPELSAVKKTDVDAIKSFLSTAKDTLRKAYGHADMDYYRQGICVITINPRKDEPIVQDETGHRRFWVIDTPVRVNLDAIEEDRDQIYAEAYSLYKSGIRPEEDILDLIPAEEKSEIIDAHIDDHYDPLEQSIGEWIDRNLEVLKAEVCGKEIRRFITYREVYEGQGIMNGFEMSHTFKIRIGRVMKNLGWNNARTSQNRYFFKDYMLE